MKKTKILILTSILTLMLMGVGYAAWSQNFTVTSNVSTGELKIAANNIKFEELTILKSNNQTYWSISNGSIKPITGNDGSISLAYSNNSKEYMNMTLKAGSNQESIMFDMKNAFPGIKAKYDVTLTNKGTVPVKFNLVDGYKDGNLAMISGMNEETKKLIDSGLLQASISPNYSSEGGSDPSGIILGVGDSETYTIEIEISPSLTDAQLSNLVCELKFDFTQATN